jgi:hypothetical protein
MSPQDKELVASYLRLRQMIGRVALLMPIAVRAGTFILEAVCSTSSLSAYYYTGIATCSFRLL